MSIRILCVGAATWDIILGVPAIPDRPTKVLAQRCVETAAGMASAAAMTIATLGGNAAVLARLGDDETGDRWLNSARLADVDTRHIERIEGARSGLSTIVVDETGERLIVPFYDPGLRDEPPRISRAVLDAFDAYLVDTRWPQASELVLRHAAEAQKPALLDADIAEAEILLALIPLASQIIFSSEALELVSDEGDTRSRLSSLDRRADAIVGVTSGARGCELLLDEHIVRIPAPAVEAIDTLAAGDVFHGAYWLRYLETGSSRQAAAFANAAAAIKCTRFGGIAGRPDRKEVEALLAREGQIS